jgi:toxin CcdB
MHQFDVFRNPNPRTAREVPFLVSLQHGLLDALETRLVAPLVPTRPLGRTGITRLNPVVVVNGQRYLILMQQLGAVRARALGRPVDTLESHRSVIIAAMDLLVSGV